MLPSQIALPAFDQLPALLPSELDAIAVQTAETLANLLANDTLSKATVKSYASALRYWDAWHRASSGDPLPLLRDPRRPVPTETVCAFVAHHAPVEVDGVMQMAMPATVYQRLKQLGGIGKRLASRRSTRIGDDVPTLATVKHRIAALSACHRIAQIEPPFAGVDVLRQALKALSNRVSREVPGMLRQPKTAVTREMLTMMIRNCAGTGLKGLRDAALLQCAFNTGGRRRSELADMRWPDLAPMALPEPIDGIRDGYLLTLHKVKGKLQVRADKGVMQIPILGSAADALDRWRDAATAHRLPADGPVWYRVIRVEGPEGEKTGWAPSTPMIAADVWAIIREHALALGLNPDEFGAHSLRSGSVTTFLREGGALADASAMLGHAKLETTRQFYDQRGVPVEAIARLVSRQKS